MNQNKRRNRHNMMNNKIRHSWVIISANNNDNKIRDKITTAHLHCHFAQLGLWVNIGPVNIVHECRTGQPKNE